MTARIASLGMYDHPGQRDANDRLWREIARILRARGVAEVPAALDHGRAVQAIWRDPALLLGQACGYPLVAEPDLALRVVAAPIYAVPDCDAGEHRSYFVTRRDDAETALAGYRGRRAAINDRGSNTGLNLFRVAVAGLAGGQSFFSEVRETGAHRKSIAAIVRGEADIAAIDAVTYAAIHRFEPEVTASLRILGKSVTSPTPPFVTARGTSVETVSALRMALASVVADPALAEVRDTLFLRDIVPAGKERFAPLRDLEAEAVAAGYPQLH
jgi:ABC-type phosphate/phosphonate transport system substrate-binding protein